MWFFIERAVDESLRNWEEIGATEVTGVGADAYAVEHLAASTGIYRARAAAPPDEIPTVFSVDSEGHANIRATV